MTAETPEGTTPDPTDAPQDGPAETPEEKPLGEPGTRALTAERELRKSAEKRAKDTERELNRLRQASMSDQERAIAEARDAARRETLTTVGERLARAELKAAAAVKQVDITELLDDLDVRKFVTDDGDIDQERVNATVARFAALKPQKAPSFDGGVRAAAPAPTNMNDFIRNQVGIRGS